MIFFWGEGFLRMSFNVLCITSLEISFLSMVVVVVVVVVVPFSLSLFLSLSFFLLFFFFCFPGSRPPQNKPKTHWHGNVRRASVAPPHHPPRSVRGRSQKAALPAAELSFKSAPEADFVLKSMHVLTV